MATRLKLVPGENGQQIDVSTSKDEFAALEAGWRGLLPPKKKIAIVGKAPDSMALAPWGDESWQIWVLNDMPVRNECPRWDACFELHDHNFAKENPEHWAWMQQQHGKPIFMRARYPQVPDCCPLPVEECLKFGRYYTNTVSWMIALALLTQPEEIGLWGCNMAANDEYSHQRPSCEYFLGLAIGAGVRVTLPPQSDLLKTGVLYGVETSAMVNKWQSRFDELLKRKADSENRARQADAETYFFQGAMDNMNYVAQWFHCTPRKF